MKDTLDISETPDLHSSSEEYARRFSGEIGRWFLEQQRETIKDLLGDKVSLGAVCDIGGGHGQLYELYATSNNSVILSSCEEAAMQAKKLAGNLSNLQFKVAPLAKSELPEKFFDTVFSFRIFAHYNNTEALVAELTRISKGRVIIDAPLIDPLATLLFPIKKLIEGNTRRYLSFKEKELEQLFLRHGFKLKGVKREYFLPMALHRKIASRKISEKLESFFELLHFKKIFGNPAILSFEAIDIS
jgi:2-polyprenyl-3-methyl-5-hydroxy-6-metoxy-1,4-benzoquinol methylase